MRRLRYPGGRVETPGSPVPLTVDRQPAAQRLPDSGDAAGVESLVVFGGSADGHLPRGAAADRQAVSQEGEGVVGGGGLGPAAQGHGGSPRHREGRALQQHGAVWETNTRYGPASEGQPPAAAPVPVMTTVTSALRSPLPDSHQYSPLSDGYVSPMAQVEPEEAVPQPEVQGRTPPPSVLLFTLQPVEFSRASQLRVKESYRKN